MVFNIRKFIPHPEIDTSAGKAKDGQVRKDRRSKTKTLIPKIGSLILIDEPKAKVQSKSQIPGLGLSLKSYGPPPHPTPPITFRRSGCDYMVQIEAPRTPECQEGIPSQGGQRREEHRVVHHVQEEHYQGNLK